MGGVWSTPLPSIEERLPSKIKMESAFRCVTSLVNDLYAIEKHTDQVIQQKNELDQEGARLLQVHQVLTAHKDGGVLTESMLKIYTESCTRWLEKCKKFVEFLLHVKSGIIAPELLMLELPQPSEQSPSQG